MRRKWTILPAVAAALAIVACAAEQTDHDHHEPPARYLTESDIQHIAATSEGFQKEILADAKVTFAEYEKATRATIDCISGKEIPGGKLKVDGPHPRRLDNDQVDEKFLEYAVEVEGGPTVDGAALDKWAEEVSKQSDAANNDCRNKYLTDVERVWLYQHLLTPEARNEQRTLVVECLRTAGLHAADNSTDEEVYRLMADNINNPKVTECRGKYRDYFVAGIR